MKVHVIKKSGVVYRIERHLRANLMVVHLIADP
jgi:hypothetical protein